MRTQSQLIFLLVPNLAESKGVRQSCPSARYDKDIIIIIITETIEVGNPSKAWNWRKWV